jgi:hypothetical protein
MERNQHSAQRHKGEGRRYDAGSRKVVAGKNCLRLSACYLRFCGVSVMKKTLKSRLLKVKFPFSSQFTLFRPSHKHILAAQLAAFTLCSLLFVLANTSANSRLKKEITFTGDVAVIFYKNCADCHRPQDIAPFSVLAYKEVRPWARSIREKVVTRQMPPWYADRRHGDFENITRLSQTEIDTIVGWVDQGAREGDPKFLPPPPDYSQEWKIGKPDQVFSMTQDYVIEPEVPDNYVYYTMPTRFREDKWIQAAEIRPGNKKVVHHVIAHILTPAAIAKSRAGDSQSRSETQNESNIFYKEGGLARVKQDAPVIDDGAKLPNGGAVFKRQISEQGSDLFSILLASYAPGKAPDIYAQGMAKKIPAGSLIVLQLHYSSFRGALAQPQTDRTSVALVFAKEPPDKEVRTLTVANHFFKIPPGADNHAVTASHTFDQDVELINYMPHMHLRGKDMKYEAIYPNGRREILLWVPRFNFNWQTVYRLKNAITMPKGTKLIVTAHFDNSPANRYNPDPTKAVRWGDPTYDEMMVGWLDYVMPKTH